MRMLVFSALLLTASPAFADVAPPPDDGTRGTWVGTMTQYEASGQRSYAMRLSIDDDGYSGTTDYPKLHCGGTVSRLGDADGYITYREAITRGAYDEKRGGGCVDGLMTLRVEGDTLYVGWFATFNGAPIVASATLKAAAE